MKPQSLLFKKLVEFIRDIGYTVETKYEPPRKKLWCGYWFGRITGKSIFGGFCEPNKGGSYWYINGRVAFDNKRCFDKWSKCPYSLELPQTMREFQYIMEQMKYLRTKEGFNRSCGYDLWVKDYPFSTYVLCPECRGSKKVLGKRKLKMRPKDIAEAKIFRKASGLNPDEGIPKYRSAYIKCPKCRGKGKIKRPKRSV
jgi:hypothetical protein